MNIATSFSVIFGLCFVFQSRGLAEEDFFAVKPIREVKTFQDVRVKDLSGIDLSTRPELPATLWFHQKTVWPAHLPNGVDPERLLSQAMNPGLGVHQLHAQGVTGKGVNVAIIDQ